MPPTDDALDPFAHVREAYHRTATRGESRAVPAQRGEDDDLTKRAEESVISAMMGDRAAIPEARRTLTAASFADPSCAHIFRAICTLADNDTPADALTLATELDRQGVLDRVGGRDYLGYLIDVTPTSASVEYHAKLVAEGQARRDLRDTLDSLTIDALAPGSSPAEIAQRAITALLPVAARREDGGHFRPIGDDILSVIERIEERGRLTSAGKSTGVPSGFYELDKITHGWQPGELVIFGARPKCGKTALCVNIALNNALEGRAAGFVSAEMTRQQLQERCLNALGMVGIGATSGGTLNGEEWKRLAEAGHVLTRAPLHIADAYFPSLDDVVARCCALKAEHPDIVLVVVDYLQLLTDKKMRNRRGDEEIAEVCKALKGMAKRLGVAVLAPAQVNYKQTDQRGGEGSRSTDAKAPTSADLQGGSGMGQTADFVIMLHRPALFNPALPDRLELHIAESRRTDRHSIILDWRGAYFRVESPASRYAADHWSPATQ